MSDYDLEQRLQDLGLNAPRVTPDRLREVISSVHFFSAAEGAIGDSVQVPQDVGALDLLTICVIVLKNGFTVLGQSACASPENFDPGTGKEIAYENALREIWPLEGYLLKQQLADGERVGIAHEQ